MTKTPPEVDKKGVVLKLQPLSDIDIDIWSNNVGHYYRFKGDLTKNLTDDKVTLVGASTDSSNQQLSSRRGNKDINYTSMLTSDQDSESKTVCKKPRN